MDGQLSPERVEAAVVSVKDARFRILSPDEVKKYAELVLGQK